MEAEAKSLGSASIIVALKVLGTSKGKNILEASEEMLITSQAFLQPVLIEQMQPDLHELSKVQLSHHKQEPVVGQVIAGSTILSTERPPIIWVIVSWFHFKIPSP